MTADEPRKNTDFLQPDADGEDGSNRKLDEKLMELQSLFEVSQTLNSSLNLKSILDNILLTPMGKMMISRGMVLLYHKSNKLRVETLKGYPQKLIGKLVDFQSELIEPIILKSADLDLKQQLKFFLEKEIELLLPIHSGDKVLGYISFGKKMTGSDYSKSELTYLKSLANIAATSIENGLMVMELQQVNRRLDKKIQELNTLFEIGKELNSTLDRDKILNLLGYAVMGEMIINRCLVFLDEDGEMKLSMSKGLQQGEKENLLHDSRILEQLSQIAEPIYLKTDKDYDEILTHFLNNGFPVIVPMRLQNVTRGVLAIGERITGIKFQQDDLDFLSTLGNEALICLENARLFQERLKRQRIEEELALAREIQQKLLPSQCPQCENYQIDGINVPSLQVSGDYFDCVQLDENRFCLAIADVSGKGAPASLLMANLQAVLNALIETETQPNKITARINNLIHKNTNYDKFITFFLGILNKKENSFQYVNAGHNPPYLMHQDGKYESLEKGGLLLGMMPNIPYEQGEIKLKSGDWIVMFTDGVTEAQNDAKEEFGEQRLIQIMQENLSISTSAMTSKILAAVKSFSGNLLQSDDVTLLILKAL
ncbi:MAG TPA: hypothetical protein ENN22_02940 [bacterium]|nr:hypothetical protein [bacterium]